MEARYAIMVTNTKRRSAEYTLPAKRSKRRARAVTDVAEAKQIVTQVVRWISNADDADRLLLATRLGRGLRKMEPLQAVQFLYASQIIIENDIYVGDVTTAHEAVCNKNGPCGPCDNASGRPSNQTTVCCSRFKPNSLDRYRVIYSH